MKNINYILAFIAISLLSSCNTENFDIEQDKQKAANEIVLLENATEGELLIKFNPEVEPQLENNQLRVKNGKAEVARSSVESVDKVLEAISAYQLERVFPIDSRHEDRTRKSQLHLWYVVKFDPEVELYQAAQELSKLGEISGVQANHQIKRAYDANKRPVLLSEATKQVIAEKSAGVPNDPYLSKQWGMVNTGDYSFRNSVAGADINCKSAWEKTTGNPSIIVAVLDEGVMYTHEDLAANMWINEGESDVTSAEDNDGNGYEGDRYGYNFVTNSGYISWNNPYDTGHGTHVAGIVAAVGNNNLGITGVAGGKTGNGDGVKIMSCQLFDGARGANIQQEAKAIKYAADNGAVILQCSWGYNSGYANPMSFMPAFRSDEEWVEAANLEKDALDYFIHNAGSPDGVIDGGIVVFAAGNETAPMAGYPGAHPDYISVASTAADYTPPIYTNYNRQVRISAPGGDMDYHADYAGGILSTVPYVNGDPSEKRYAYLDGTSMACPAVSGIVALGLSYALEQNKHFRAEDFKKLVIETASEMTYPDEKIYYIDWIISGESFPSEMDLGLYRGNVGGMANAGKLLDAIASDDNGKSMKVPNIYLATEGLYSINLASYYKNGSSLSYGFEIENTSVASSTANGSIITVKGLKAGITKVKVTASGNEEQIVYITVRDNTEGTWMKKS